MRVDFLSLNPLTSTQVHDNLVLMMKTLLITLLVRWWRSSLLRAV